MNHVQLAKELIYHYCGTYDLSPTILFGSYGRGRKRVEKGVHVDHMRMCLGYFISENFAIYSEELATLIGYKDRSTMSSNRKRIVHYIKHQDPYFMPYWERVLEIGNLYTPEKTFFRTHNGFIRETAA